MINETVLNSSMRLSVVIPCYNEEQNIDELYKRVRTVCEKAVDGAYELVLVNDGSKDRTWQLITEIAAQDPHIVGVNLSRNHGHQLALTAGLHVCCGQRILILDADLQDPPELLGRMMDIMDAGADVVYGKRIKREGETRFKKLTASAFYRVLNSLIDIEIPVDTGDFRLLTRRALDVLLSMPESHRFIRGMVSWIGFQQSPLLYERAARAAGESKYPLGKMIRLALDAITSFSVRPLRWATYVGLAVVVLASFLALYVLYGWALGRAVEGWTSLMIVILFLGSCQLMLLGVFGEYLGRLYIESKSRPLFIIRDVIANGDRFIPDPGPSFYKTALKEKAHG